MSFRLIKVAHTIKLQKQRGVTAIEYAVIGVGMSVIVLAVFGGDGWITDALTAALATIGSNIVMANS